MEVAYPPILKWPGGKRELLGHILPLIPNNGSRYFEPFFGGGAVFFALAPRRAVISDSDRELIECYTQVRDNLKAVIRKLSGLKNTERDYYRIRRHVPDDPIGRAARVIYLSTLSFNGIHRHNLRGEFNVPYGHKTHIDPCNAETLTAASIALRHAKLVAGDFEDVLQAAGRGDVVYLDPPYTVAHGNNGFLKYNAKIFSWNDQIRLARVARQLARKGCKVVISNADHPSIRSLYKAFNCKRIERPSRIAASVVFRRRVTECIFYS